MRCFLATSTGWAAAAIVALGVLPDAVQAQSHLPGSLALLRVETVATPTTLDGPPHATFVLESFNGATRLELDTTRMSLLDTNTDAASAQCPGLTTETCVGDIVVQGIPPGPGGPRFTLSVTAGPSNATPLFSGACGPDGGIELGPHTSRTCRVTFAVTDTNKEANAAVLVTTLWDTTRRHSALPSGRLALYAQKAGGFTGEIELSDLRAGTEWLAGVTSESTSREHGEPATLVLTFDDPNWLGIIEGDCNSGSPDDVVTRGRMLTCDVEAFELEASADKPDAVLRVEVIQIGVPLKPASASFKLESADGLVSASLDLKQLYGADVLADGRQAPCAGIGPSLCSADIGVPGIVPGPASANRQLVLSVTSGPAGLIPTFSGDCDYGGRVELPPRRSGRCRITFVNPDVTESDANAAILVRKDWDVSRLAGALPDGGLTLSAERDGSVTASIALSALHADDTWIVGHASSLHEEAFVQLSEEMDKPGWLSFVDGECNSARVDDVLRSGRLMTCLVSNVALEVSSEAPNAALRIETALLGPSLKLTPTTAFRLRSKNGAIDLQLPSEKMFRLHPPSGSPEPCPGVGMDVCVGDIGVDGMFAGPLDPQFVLSVIDRPAGTVPVFSGACDGEGELDVRPGRFRTCRVTFVQIDAGVSDANAVVQVIKRWDTNRPEGPLPEGRLLLDAQPDGGRSGAMALSELRNGTEWLAGVTFASKTSAPVTITEEMSEPGWVPLVGGPCNSPGDPWLRLSKGQLFSCTVTNIAVEAYPQPAASIASASIVEGNSGLKQLTLTVSLDAPPLLPARIGYATVNGTATAPADYVAQSGTLQFAVGQTSATLSVAVVGEILGESNETFKVVLGSPLGARLGIAEAIVTIANDDDTTPPAIAFKADVIVETRTAPIAVLYTNPVANDAIDKTVRTTCSPGSGSLFPFGKTPISCSARDNNGNVATSTFNVVVRTPTTTGAVSNPGNARALTKVGPGRRVRVSAGGYAPATDVALSWIDHAGVVTPVGVVSVGADGRFDAFVQVPQSAAVGAGQMTAVGVDISGAEFVRAWQLTVVSE